jgi:hypothetical protein
MVNISIRSVRMNKKIDYLVKIVIPKLPNYIDLSELDSDFNLNQGYPLFISKKHTDIETIKAYKAILEDLKDSLRQEIKNNMILRDALSANKQVISISQLTNDYDEELEFVNEQISEKNIELKGMSEELQIIYELESYLYDLVSSVYKQDYASV